MTERHIALEGSSNLRDIGGYATGDGRRVRWNLVYRSGAMSRLTDSDWKWIEERGFQAVCDLRSDDERDLAPTKWRGGSQVRAVGPAYAAELIFGRLARRAGAENVNEMGKTLYPIFPQLLAPSFRAMFDALEEDHVPLIVHCSAGQDRTGLAIGLLLAALGVPLDVIVEDYLLSTSLRRIENEIDRAACAPLADRNLVARYYDDVLRRRGEDAFQPRPLVNRRGQPLLLDAFSQIESEWGSIAAYLHRELGVSAGRIERLRDKCLEEAPAQL